MNLFKNYFGRVYREEAGEEGEAGGGAGGESLLDGAGGGTPGDGEEPGGEGEQGWFYAEGVAGEGDRPEYLQEKYKTLADQAAAYPELAKKLGAYTGAPEEYDLTLPEGAQEHLEIDLENENTQAFLDYAKEQGISQESMGEMLKFHTQAMSEALADYVPDRDAEMAALGKDAESRINNLADWGKANLDQESFDRLRMLTTTADGIQLVETLVNMTREAPTPTDIDNTPSGKTAEELREMRYAKDDNGQLKYQVDPEYKKMVDEEYKKLYGTGPKKEVVSL
jgi:hypothetical protein